MTQRRRRSQAGFTLIELMVASAIGLIVMTGLTSVVFTTYRANQIATGRVEAAGQIRNFQGTAYNDFAGSSVTNPVGCGTSAQPCTTYPIQLQGCTLDPKTTSLKTRTVKYSWDSTALVVARAVGVGANVLPTPVNPAALHVTAFAWYLDGAAPNQSVVVTLTVSIGALPTVQSQSMRFYPRVVAQLPPTLVDKPC